MLPLSRRWTADRNRRSSNGRGTGQLATRRRVRDGLLGIVNCLVRFRRIHRAFALRAYDIRRSREPDAVGSTGYGPEVLQVTLHLTEQARAELAMDDLS
jgi:hypothetical protein